LKGDCTTAGAFETGLPEYEKVLGEQKLGSPVEPSVGTSNTDVINEIWIGAVEMKGRWLYSVYP